MKNNAPGTKYEIKTTATFNKNLKKMYKQNKNINKLMFVVEKLANKEELDIKYKNHKLINDKYFYECFECHIEPDWLLIYKIEDQKLILLLFATGSHSDLFD